MLSTLMTTPSTAALIATLASNDEAHVEVHRRGETLRIYREEPNLSMAASEAAVELVRAGATVKIASGTGIYTGGMAEDGTVVWSRRESCIDRADPEADGGRRKYARGMTAVTYVRVTA